MGKFHRDLLELDRFESNYLSYHKKTFARVLLTKVNKQTLKPIFEDEQSDLSSAALRAHGSASFAEHDNQEENFPKVLQRKEMAELMGISERSLDTKIRQAKKLSAPPVIEGI